MLSVESTILVVVDVQGKLATLMHEHEVLFANIERMVLAAKVLEFPILPVEQIPEKLGKTVPQIHQHLEEPIIAKTTFSAMGETAFASALESSGRKHVLLTGIESHICVYQTAKDLLDRGYSVTLITDGVSSRLSDNKALALGNLRELGASLSSVEMILFELMGHAEHPKFREIQKIVK